MSLLSVGCRLGLPLQCLCSRRVQHRLRSMHQSPRELLMAGCTLNKPGIEQLSVAELARAQEAARVGMEVNPMDTLSRDDLRTLMGK